MLERRPAWRGGEGERPEGIVGWQFIWNHIKQTASKNVAAAWLLAGALPGGVALAWANEQTERMMKTTVNNAAQCWQIAGREDFARKQVLHKQK